MIRYRQPKAVLGSKPRFQLEEILKSVKDLQVPELDDIPRWNEKDENDLIEFQKTICTILQDVILS